MSLILDALARAERDKRREAEPLASMIADEDPGPAANTGHRRPSPFIIGSAMLAILGAFAAWFPWDPQPAGDSPAVRESEAATVERGHIVAQGGDTPTARAKNTPLPERRVVRDEVQSLYEAAAGEEEISAEAGTELPAGEPGGRRVTSPVASREAGPEKEAGGEGSPGEESVDLERILREVQRVSDAATLAPHPTPLLAELSQQFRNAVPTLMYLRHDYNPGGSSTVLLNGDTLGVGGRTRGVEIREILPDSIVCRFEGTDFRLRALNSWVNL